MTLQQLISKITKGEGKKSQVKIGDVREVMAVLADLINSDPETLHVLIKYAAKRAKKSKKV